MGHPTWEQLCEIERMQGEERVLEADRDYFIAECDRLGTGMNKSDAITLANIARCQRMIKLIYSAIWNLECDMDRMTSNNNS